MIGQHCGHMILFISGTASIIGHESQHRDDVASQMSEIAVNLRALIAECEATGAIPVLNTLNCKVYVRNAADQGTVRDILCAHFESARSVLLQADICRPELLVEVEAVCALADAHEDDSIRV